MWSQIKFMTRKKMVEKQILNHQIGREFRNGKEGALDQDSTTGDYKRTHCDKGHKLKLLNESPYLKKYGCGVRCTSCKNSIKPITEKHGHCPLCEDDYCEECIL